jgi:UDP-glucose 4-epimerase
MTLYTQLHGRTILITGASGFIGSHLCARLCNNGLQVHAVSRTKRTAEQDGVHWWQADLTAHEAAQHIFNTIKPDLVFHMAGYAKGSCDLDQVAPALQGNLLSQVNVLTAASKAGCRRIILAGSLEEPEPGDGQITPSSPYAAAKWAASAYARMFFRLYKLPVVNLRIFMVYGPMQWDLNKLVPYVILSLLRGEAPKLSSGQRQVDWIYVNDVIDGLLAAAVTPDIEGCTVDLGSGSLTPIHTLVQHLVELIDPGIEPVFGALPDRPMEQVRVANMADTYAKIGYRPETPLQEGLRQTVEWYRQQVAAIHRL